MEEKNIDNIIKDSELYSPSEDFTVNIMSAVLNEEILLQPKEEKNHWAYLLLLFISPFLALAIIDILVPGISFLKLFEYIFSLFSDFSIDISMPEFSLQISDDMLLIIKLLIPVAFLLGIEYIFSRKKKTNTLLF